MANIKKIGWISDAIYLHKNFKTWKNFYSIFISMAAKQIKTFPLQLNEYVQKFAGILQKCQGWIYARIYKALTYCAALNSVIICQYFFITNFTRKVHHFDNLTTSATKSFEALSHKPKRALRLTCESCTTLNFDCIVRVHFTTLYFNCIVVLLSALCSKSWALVEHRHINREKMWLQFTWQQKLTEWVLVGRHFTAMALCANEAEG